LTRSHPGLAQLLSVEVDALSDHRDLPSLELSRPYRAGGDVDHGSLLAAQAWMCGWSVIADLHVDHYSVEGEAWGPIIAR